MYTYIYILYLYAYIYIYIYAYIYIYIYICIHTFYVHLCRSREICAYRSHALPLTHIHTHAQYMHTTHIHTGSTILEKSRNRLCCLRQGSWYFPFCLSLSPPTPSPFPIFSFSLSASFTPSDIHNCIHVCILVNAKMWVACGVTTTSTLEYKSQN